MTTTPKDLVPLLKQLGSINLSSELLADVGLVQELIIEILLRLPVKSLSKFKCVSKPWLSLISSPKFIRSHFNTSESKEELFVNSSHILYVRMGPTKGLTQFSLSSALYEPSVNVSDIDEYPSDKPGQAVVILGIINGLVCLYGAHTFFLWNPVLRKSKRIPSPKFGEGSKICSPGFGYDESNDDYRVVVTVVDCNNEHVVMVYSLQMDSWRKIDDFGGISYTLCGLGEYANGKIHWIASCSVHEWKIVTLDMVCDKYGELQCPNHEAGEYRRVLGGFRGKLSVLYDYDVKKKADLWVMDKYGVEESWTKVVSIPTITFKSVPNVVCILGNGEIVVLTDGMNILVYRSKDNELRIVEIDGVRPFLFAQVCVESLVSP